MDDDNEEPFTKNTFIDAIKGLHIGEWRRHIQLSASNFYSFASKYCSHHNPLDYPIYDIYVDEVLPMIWINIT